MLIRLNLQNALIRRGYFVIIFVILVLLVKVVLGEFIVGTLSDKRFGANEDLLNASTEYFPASARLLARLAENEAAEPKPDFERAEKHIRQAINLSPNNYQYRLLLAEIRDFRGDQAGAEQSFDEALRLASNYSEVHWKIANFLIRQNRIEESIEHFRLAADANPTLIAATLDLVWTASNKNTSFLSRIVRDNQKGQLKLALLLANQSQISEAAEIFSKINRDVRLPAWESSSFFDALIKKGFSKLAGDLWIQLKGGEGETISRSLIWNGDFEAENDSLSTQFDWQIGKSEFARIGLDNSQTHSGKRSLLLDFLGRDTTKLNNEVKHLIAARTGINYRLDYFVKTEEFKTTEVLRVVISDWSGNRIAQSDPISTGTNNWKQMSVNFTAPPILTGDAAALIISVKRQPRYSFDEPTRGRVWFDDFSMNEVKGK